MRTELLVSINKKNLLGTDKESFKHLIMASGNIKIKGDSIEYRGKKYSCKIKEYEADKNVDVVNYHIILGLDGNVTDLDSEDVKGYSNFQSYIEMILRRDARHIEILWDDLSIECSKTAYPLINSLENKMRMLITKFMLVNVGTNWVNKNIPEQMKNAQSMRRLDREYDSGEDEKETDKLGILYDMDFKDLPDVLFKNYPFERDQLKLQRLKDSLEKNEPIKPEDIEPFIPRSNWERYFGSLIGLGEKDFTSKWNELYKYRCTIAHNRRLRLGDLDKVRKLSAPLERALDEAINKLDTIKMPTEDREYVSESIGSTRSYKILRLNEMYELIRQLLFELYYISGAEGLYIRRARLSADLLYSYHIIDERIHAMAHYIGRVRNACIHSDGVIVDEATIDDAIRQADECIIYLKAKIEKYKNASDDAPETEQ